MEENYGNLILTPAEYPFYQRLWALANPDGKPMLEGSLAADFLAKSGLVTEVLYHIWGIVDHMDQGALSFEAFCAACRLIAHAQNGAQNLTAELALQEPCCIPVFNFSYGPPSDVSSVISALEVVENSAPTKFYISEEQKSKYLRLMEGCVSHEDGLLDGNVLRPVFQKSGLSDPDLAQIWSLVDRDGDGSLTPSEFVVAMHLITLVIKGLVPIPTTLPQSLVHYIENNNTISYNNNSCSDVSSGTVTKKYPPKRRFGDLVAEERLKASGSSEEVFSDDDESFIAAGNRIRQAKSNKDIIREAIKADRVLARELAVDVNDLAEELAELTNVGEALKKALADGKMEIRKQRERKADFEREISKKKQDLKRLKEYKKKLDHERISLHRDADHYQNEILFLRGEINELDQDIAYLQDNSSALQLSIENVNSQTAQLHETHKLTLNQIDSERSKLEQQEEEIALLRRKLQVMRRDKAEYQAKYAVLQERLRQADQDRTLHLHSLENDRLTLAALQADRLTLTEEKMRLTGNVMSLEQQEWGLAKGTNNVESSPMPLPRDSKGVPTTTGLRGQQQQQQQQSASVITPMVIRRSSAVTPNTWTSFVPMDDAEPSERLGVSKLVSRIRDENTPSGSVDGTGSPHSRLPRRPKLYEATNKKTVRKKRDFWSESNSSRLGIPNNSTAAVMNSGIPNSTPSFGARSVALA